jgi:ribonuclease Y
MNATALSAALGVLVIVASVAFFFFGRRAGQSAERAAQSAAKATAEQTAKRIVGEAEREAESLKKSALISGKEELIKLRENWEVEARRRREEVEREEKRVQDREAVLDRKFDVLEQREKEVGRRGSELGRKEKAIAEREQELDKLMGDERRRLESLAGMSAEQAKAEPRRTPPTAFARFARPLAGTPSVRPGKSSRSRCSALRLNKRPRLRSRPFRFRTTK